MFVSGSLSRATQAMCDPLRFKNNSTDYRKLTFR